MIVKTQLGDMVSDTAIYGVRSLLIPEGGDKYYPVAGWLLLARMLPVDEGAEYANCAVLAYGLSEAARDFLVSSLKQAVATESFFLGILGDTSELVLDIPHLLVTSAGVLA